MLKRCKQWRCPNLHNNANGFCDSCNAKWKAKHPEYYAEREKRKAERERETNRPTSRQRGYSYKWTVFAKQFLQQHPTCAICGAPSQVCDHKTATADMMMDAWGSFDYDPSNYQALCYRCNNRKGRTEDVQMREEYFSMKKLIDGSDG